MDELQTLIKLLNLRLIVIFTKLSENILKTKSLKNQFFKQKIEKLKFSNLNFILKKNSFLFMPKKVFKFLFFTNEYHFLTTNYTCTLENLDNSKIFFILMSPIKAVVLRN